MSDSLNFYQEQAREQFSTIPSLLEMQENALADFSAMGFPTRYMEEWKYTKLDGFLEQRFQSMSTTRNTARPTDLSDKPVPTHTISILNGVIEGCEALAATLPEGMIVQPITQALLEHQDKVKPYLNQILRQQNGFHALNTAMLQVGLFIYVPKKVCVTEPLLLSHWQDNPEQATHLRHLVIMDEGSSLTLMEDYQGDANTCYFSNTVTEVALAPQAKLTHYKFQREGSLAYHMGHLAVKQAKSSDFSSHSFSLGGQWVRSDITINLEETGAKCLMNGIYMPTGISHMDHHTRVSHDAPNCQSTQDYKGILSGNSRAVFNGQVFVAKDAQHTLAKQSNKNLLLSKNTEIDTKPQLEIFADDVVCTHGATVGQLDEDALFYLATRGIDREQATRYLVQAFMVENIRLLPDADVVAWIGSLL